MFWSEPQATEMTVAFDAVFEDGGGNLVDLRQDAAPWAAAERQ